MLMQILQNNVQRFYNECCAIVNRDVANDKEFLQQVDIIVNNLSKSQNETFKYPSYSQGELKAMAKQIYGN